MLLCLVIHDYRVYLEQLEIVVQLVQLVNKELLDLLVFLVQGNYWSYLVET